jgi:amino acid adenylation domain-containing protein
VTYAALDRRANQLARHLIGRGVRPGGFVGVCLERSAGMITAVMAVLKTGAAYVPIDARFPAERIALLASRGDVVLVDRFSRRSVDGVSVPVVDLEAEAAQIDRMSSAHPGVDVIGDQVAYLMHTSGSSGQPKGTLVTHRNVTAMLAAAITRYPSQTAGVWSFFHSIAFDFSVWEVFGALLSGGRVAVTPYWLARSPDRFAEFVRRAQVTMLSQTPSAFQELLTNGRLVDDDAGALSLQWVVFGGEALHLAPLRRFWPLLSRHGVRLLNMYGITETTVHVTHRPMDDLDALDDRRSRIGAALPHLRLAVVDARLRPVPEGVAGELVVGGEGVAIGYADAPRLTAERFVPSPFEGDEGRRLYRSGDLGRALGASDVEYLGRSDRQVKVRGFRIELEEVRFYLLRHTSERDAVRDAVVQVVEDRAGDRVLAAFVAPASPEFDVAALRQRLRTQLPEHMIPAALHVVDRFPLTANGKIDSAALIALAANGPAARRIVLPPQTWEQDLIAEVWRDLLGVPEVGIHDSFFALGGDSIKALRVTARLRSLGLPATTEALFHHPTVAELSRALSSPSGPLPLAPRDGDATAPRDEEKSGSSLAWPPGVIDAYPVTQMQLGMLFHAAQADGTSVPYHNVTVITLQGGFDEARFRDALARLVAAHETLRTAFHLEAAVRPMQLVYECVETPLTVERPGGLSAAAERAHIDEWVAREKTAAFAIERAPLIRFHVMACGPERWHLGITEHHAILDGWSVARLLTELFERYCGLDAPDDTPRPRAERLNVCREYALLERAALSSPAHEAFWRDYLDDYVPLQLPVRWDDDLPDAASGAGACAQPPLDRQTRDVVRIRRRAIEPAVAAGLRSLAVEAQSPVKSVLLAAHMAVLAAATNTPDTITGVITHGRPEVDGGEAGLGLFLNTLPFRLKQAHVSWTRWIRAVFDEERRTLPYRRYPLAAMRDRSGRPPELSAAFNYTNFHIYERLAHDAAVSATDLEVHESTNFDWLTTFSVMARTGELELTLAYRTRTFSDAQAEALLDGYTHCLARMVAEPAALMSSRPLWDDAVPPGAPGALASIAAASAADRAPEATIHDLLEHAKGAARADRILAVDGDRQLSAQALWRRVRTASAYLRQLGVSFEQPVAVLLDKSLEWLIAALAIFDAGAVYAPIDPSDPAERVRYIISDTGAAVLITDAAGARTAEGLPLRTVRVDRDELGAGSSMPAVAGERMPQALAYILYTSGSTGVPKGVGLPHGALANLLQWQTRAMPLIHERILQYASVGFDVSVQEILSAIVGGSALVLVPSRLRRDFVALSHVVAEQQVSCLFAADTVIKALLLAGDAEGLPLDALTTIVNAGEPLVVDAALARFLDAGGALYNHYGPTESHVVTGTAVARRNASSPRASIGRAIDRTDILILDAWQRPVPPGTLGELHIASANVARGYHRAPKQTARRFVPHPGPDAMPGERVFRTGDLGHRDVQGDIWYRGRTDTQVKLRGYRVEQEEVRHALLRHPDVTDAVVTVAGRDREARLAAYVVPAGPVDHEALRSFVRVTLPAYMVPAAIIEIPSVPMTRNGKIDQAALAAMAPPARGPSAPRAPLSPLEARLRVLWSEVLQRDADLSRDDDFLLAGGTSILLLQLQLKIHSAFAVRVPLASLAVHSSLAEMSACLGDLIEAGAPCAVPGPAAVTRGGDTSCRTSA